MKITIQFVLLIVPARILNACDISLRADLHGCHPYRPQFHSLEQCCNRVNNNNINRTAAYELFCNFKCLLTEIRLRHNKRINIYAQISGINRVKCVLCVNKCSVTAKLLSLSNTMKCKGSFTTCSGP